MMGLQRQVVDLEQTEARLLTDGAKDSTLRQLLTQRREGAGKHLWMGVDEQSVPDRASLCQVIDQTGVIRWRSGSRLSDGSMVDQAGTESGVVLCQWSDWLRLVG